MHPWLFLFTVMGMEGRNERWGEWGGKMPWVMLGGNWKGVRGGWELGAVTMVGSMDRPWREGFKAVMGRDLGVQPWGCVGGAQSPRGRMAAGVRPGSGRARSAPPPSLFPLSLEPGAAVAALCACSCGSGSVRRPGPPRGQFRNCTAGGAPRPRPPPSGRTVLRHQRDTPPWAGPQNGFIPRRLRAADLARHGVV